jgi:hypothetical protein
LKYIIEIFLICFIFFILITGKNFSHIEGKKDYTYQNISIKKNIYNNYLLPINDTFSISGSLISTIPRNSSLVAAAPSAGAGAADQSNDNATQPINTLNTKINSQKAIQQYLAANTSNNISSSQSINQQLQKHTLLSNTKSSIPNTTETLSNSSNNISDNLVSLLSGIIIESIHNGNPTINNANNTLTSKSKINNDIILASGKWNLDVQNGNITNFSSKFLMIESNGTGFHWYYMKNFSTKEKVFLGDGDSAAVNGKLDFFTGINNSTKKTANVLLTINNLELIQIIPLDKVVDSYFHGYPLYGTIDSIKIKN